MDLRNGGGWVSCDGESSFIGWDWWVGEMIGKEVAIIGIYRRECRWGIGYVIV